MFVLSKHLDREPRHLPASPTPSQPSQNRPAPRLREVWAVPFLWLAAHRARAFLCHGAAQSPFLSRPPGVSCLSVHLPWTLVSPRLTESWHCVLSCRWHGPHEGWALESSCPSHLGSPGSSACSWVRAGGCHPGSLVLGTSWTPSLLQWGSLDLGPGSGSGPGPGAI